MRRLERIARPIAAVGFDLGETLLTYADTPPSWSELYHDALMCVAEKTGSIPTAAEYAAAAGLLAQFNTRLFPRREEIPAETIFRRCLASWKTPVAPPLANAITAFFDFFQRRLRSYPETAAVLGALRARGIRIGVLTDVPYGMPRECVQRDLAGTKLETLVNVLLTSVDVGWRKPETICFHALAEKLGVAVSELWYVGNEEKDMVGAANAGAIAVLIDRANLRPRWGQSHTLRDLRGLLPLLKA